MTAAALTTAALGGLGADWAAQAVQAGALQAQVQAYARISEAVGTYLTLHFATLSDVGRLPAACEQVPPRDAQPRAPDRAAAAGPASCQASLAVDAQVAAGGAGTSARTAGVANALQPTLPELKALGLLDPSLAEDLLLPTAPAAPATARGYGVLIERQAVAGGVVLNALVYNRQPLGISRRDLNTLLRLSGDRGATSGLLDGVGTPPVTNPGLELQAVSGAWRHDNPVRAAGAPGGGGAGGAGLPGIFAWRNGFQAHAAQQMVLRDGSLPPSADWDFGGHGLAGVGRLDARELGVVAGVRIGGALEARGLLQALADLVVEGATNLQGALVVAGPAQFAGAVDLRGDVTIAPGRRLVVGDGESDGEGRTLVTQESVRTRELITSGIRSSADGTLLGAAGDVGVDAGAACTAERALAQQRQTGKLLVCRLEVWTPLFSEGMAAVDPTTPCGPEGALALAPDGTVLACRQGQWAPAGTVAAAGQACSTDGTVASAGGTAAPHLLVCRQGRWQAEVYARPRLDDAVPHHPCRADELHALARNALGPQAGLLLCTEVGGLYKWSFPWARRPEKYIDYDEYFEVTFSWEPWHYPRSGQPNWGQRLRPEGWNGEMSGKRIEMRHYRGRDEHGRPLLVARRSALAEPYRDVEYGGHLCTGTACVPGGNYFYVDFVTPTLTTCGHTVYRPVQGPAGFPAPNPAPGRCGEAWTNPHDPDETGIHPGLVLVAGTDSETAPARTDFIWVRPSVFRLQFFRSTSWEDPTYRLRMYRIRERSYSVVE